MPWTKNYRHTRQDKWIQTELAFTLAKNATKPNPVEIIPLQTARKENNWKTEETLAKTVVTLETERIKLVQSLMIMIMIIMILLQQYIVRRSLLFVTIQSCKDFKNNIIYEGWKFNRVTIYLQLIQNRYMFRSFTVLHCSHQHCVQPVASDVEVVGYL